MRASSIRLFVVLFVDGASYARTVVRAKQSALEVRTTNPFSLFRLDDSPAYGASAVNGGRTNKRMRASSIRLFVVLFVDGASYARTVVRAKHRGRLVLQGASAQSQHDSEASGAATLGTVGEEFVSVATCAQSTVFDVLQSLIS